jgi:hypothetical protein
MWLETLVAAFGIGSFVVLLVRRARRRVHDEPVSIIRRARLDRMARDQLVNRIEDWRVGLGLGAFASIAGVWFSAILGVKWLFELLLVVFGLTLIGYLAASFAEGWHRGISEHQRNHPQRSKSDGSTATVGPSHAGIDERARVPRGKRRPEGIEHGEDVNNPTPSSR